MNKFVYSLLDGDNVFYIGCAADIHARYKAHIKVKATTKTSLHIQSMIKNGRYPEISIMFYLPTVEAMTKESELIKMLTTAGHKLTNHQFNWGQWQKRLINRLTDERDILKIVKYRQEAFIFRDKHNLQSNVFTGDFPKYPKLNTKTL